MALDDTGAIQAVILRELQGSYRRAHREIYGTDTILEIVNGELVERLVDLDEPTKRAISDAFAAGVQYLREHCVVESRVVVTRPPVTLTPPETDVFIGSGRGRIR